MAKQHFYSRVPARMSLFYKSNGFDTFASSNVDRTFIEKTLAPVLEQRPTPEEIKLIRQNMLAPIYCHYLTSDGSLVLSCVSFLEKDYSGERTSYLVHSLILNDEEEKELHSNTDKETLNDALFIHNLDSFDIDNPKSKPIRDYEEKDVILNNLSSDPKSYFASFDSILLKKLVFALLASITGKYKSVFVVLSEGQDELEFFNNLMQILPFHLRKYVSFVSHVSDFNKYSNFKLKIIDKAMGDAPKNKGVTINFASKTESGIKDNVYKVLAGVYDLIFDMHRKPEERAELFSFFKTMYDAQNVDLKPLDAKTMIDSCLLFRVGSGLFEERKVLSTDDQVTFAFDAYAKQRNYLSEEYRRNIVKTLNRYPESYNPIPKQVFSKLASIYPSETKGTKHIIMNVCLELIHTDLMRKPLFSFIKLNYETEDDETKDVIINNLCSVFNGEFLQPEILSFFDAKFSSSKDETRLNILETLFLSIRTVSIQDELFKFFNSHYDDFNEQEKAKFYEEVALHLPEGDELTKKLLILCDENITKEGDSLKEVYSKSLLKLIDNEQKLKENMLLSVVTLTSGFTFNTICEALFKKRTFRKVLTNFIVLSSRGTLDERIKKIIIMWTQADLIIEEKITKKFISAVLEGYNTYACNATLEEVFSAKDYLDQELKDKNTQSYIEFKKIFKEKIFDKLISDALLLVFRSDVPGAVEKLIEYASTSEEIKSDENYKYLLDYVALKEAINNLDYSTLFSILLSLKEDSDISRRMAQYLNVDVLSSFGESVIYDYSFVLTLIAINMLRSKHININGVYEKILEKIFKVYDDTKENKRIIQESVVKTVLSLMNASCAILKLNNEELKEDVYSQDAGIYLVASDCIRKYSKKQLKVILKKMPKDFSKDITTKTKKTKTTASMFCKVVKL